jgi:succinoglycan biosynthesis protein ExoA
MLEREEAPARGVELSPLVDRPLCSIIIPCYQEEAHIEAVLRTAMDQDYCPDLIEILVVDGGSIDRTRMIVRALAALDPRIRLLHNPRRIQAAAMNIGIRSSRGDVIIRMDAHAEYAVNHVTTCVRVLRRTGAFNVGGAQRPRSRGGFQRAVAAALSSPLGAGGSAQRDAAREGCVESVWNGAFRREAFELAGLYDPSAVTNEDAELNQRILEAGGRVYLSRDVVSFYYPRGSLGEVIQQYYAYGRGRARTLLRRRRLLSVRPIAPFLFTSALLCLLLMSAVHRATASLLAGVLIGYVAAIVAESIRLGWRKGPGLIPRLWTIFPAIHLSHGIGFAVGLAECIRAGVRPVPPERLAAR